MHESWNHAARISREHGGRAAPVAAAIRAAQSRALEIAIEADTDGRPGIARALRRKVAAPRPGDIIVEHLVDRVRVRIAAYGVMAQATRGTRLPAPGA